MNWISKSPCTRISIQIKVDDRIDGKVTAADNAVNWFEDICDLELYVSKSPTLQLLSSPNKWNNYNVFFCFVLLLLLYYIKYSKRVSVLLLYNASWDNLWQLCFNLFNAANFIKVRCNTIWSLFYFPVFVYFITGSSWNRVFPIY